MKKLLWLIPALPVLGILLLWFNRDYVEQVAFEGSGFSAKYLCSGVFVSGYDPAKMLEEAVIPASPILNWVGYNVDYTARTVTADMLGHYPRQAVFRENLGCTLRPLQGNITEPAQPLINTTPETPLARWTPDESDRKSTRLNSSHSQISYAVFFLKKKINRCQVCQYCSASPHPHNAYAARPTP